MMMIIITAIITITIILITITTILKIKYSLSTFPIKPAYKTVNIYDKIQKCCQIQYERFSQKIEGRKDCTDVTSVLVFPVILWSLRAHLSFPYTSKQASDFGWLISAVGNKHKQPHMYIIIIIIILCHISMNCTNSYIR